MKMSETLVKRTLDAYARVYKNTVNEGMRKTVNKNVDDFLKENAHLREDYFLKYYHGRINQESVRDGDEAYRRLDTDVKVGDVGESPALP